MHKAWRGTVDEETPRTQGSVGIVFDIERRSGRRMIVAAELPPVPLLRSLYTVL